MSRTPPRPASDLVLLRRAHARDLAQRDRLLASLITQLETKERERAEAIERADVATDRLLAVYAVQGISAATSRVTQSQTDSMATFAKVANADMFAELPYGDPDGVLHSEADADDLAAELPT